MAHEVPGSPGSVQDARGLGSSSKNRLRPLLWRILFNACRAKLLCLIVLQDDCVLVARNNLWRVDSDLVITSEGGLGRESKTTATHTKRQS